MKNDRNWSTLSMLPVIYKRTGLKEHSSVVVKLVASLTERVLKKAHCKSIQCLSCDRGHD